MRNVTGKLNFSVARLLRRSLVAPQFAALICLVLSSGGNALASTFAPSREELVTVEKQDLVPELQRLGIEPQVDNLGIRFYEIDDMHFEAGGVETDNAFTGNRWTNGVVFYVFDPDVTAANRQLWRDAAAAWSAVAALTFTESMGAGNYIYVQNSTGNSSFVGMIGGRQTMNIFNWNFKYIIAHEIGHALGLQHEQSRSDRDSFVQIFFANITFGTEFNFDKLNNTVLYGAYDFDSVMHYPRTAFSRNGLNTIEPLPAYAQFMNTMGQRNALSSLDGFGMAQRYGGGGGGGPTAPANDNFAARRVISGASGSLSTSNVNATKEANEPLHAGANGGRSVWFTWTAPATGTATIDTQQSTFDTVLGAYTGNSVGGLVLVAQNDDISQAVRQSSVTFAATAGVVYQVAVDGYNAESGTIQLQWNLAGVPTTSNDNFANRQVLGGDNGSVAGNNAGATKEGGEPAHAGNGGGRSVWYHWTAPLNGSLTVDTRQSNFDTLLAVYTGNSVNALALIAANDDFGETRVSSVTLPVVAGTTYQIAVDGYNADSGAIQIGWAFTPTPNSAVNDNFANAQTVPGSGGSVNGTNMGATKEGGEPNHAGFLGGRSIWYFWTPNSTGPVSISTSGSGFDTLLGVYLGGSVNALSQLTSNDDDPAGGRSSRVNFTATAGTSYRIAVDGYNGEAGNVLLQITPGTNTGRVANIATRLRVGTGDNVLIGGFIITGNPTKRVIVRAIGPSLAGQGVAGALADTTLELHGAGGLIASNDDWQQSQAEILASGLPPSSQFESAIVRTLQPGAYTAIVRGFQNSVGVGLVEIYDLEPGNGANLANIATRGFVQTGDNVMIGGVIVQGSNAVSVIVRARGPSLTAAGVPSVLQDPTLELYNAQGTVIGSNDDWKQTQQTQIQNSGFAPGFDVESALIQTVAPGAYTAIVKGFQNTTGNAIIEVYTLN